jgi:glycosyltransferase involved in cell wall biosynthesis
MHYSTFSLFEKRECLAYGRLLDEFKPHVVHTHRFLAEFLSSQYVSAEIAYVCHGHDNMVQLANAGLRTWLRRESLTNWLEKRWLIHEKYQRTRTAFVANSTHTLAYYRAVLPRSMRGDVHLIPYGFDYDRFRADELRVPKPGERLRIVNVGSFQDKKNQIFIVPIADELRKANVDFEIHLLGDGANRPSVQRAVDDHRLGDRITLHGNVDRVEDWLRRSHVYLHTARYEPFGLVLLEAMAAGLPCVVLDGKGNRDLIQENRNGYVIEREDAGAFAARIRELAASPAAYRAMADYAREYAQGFAMKHAVERYVDFYRQRTALRDQRS